MMKRGFGCFARATRDESDLRSVVNSVTLLVIAGDISRQHAIGLAYKSTSSTIMGTLG